MSKQEINTKLEELLSQPMDAQRAAEGKDILASYQTILVHDHKEQLEKYIADGGVKEDFSPRQDELDHAFSEVWTKFTQSKTSWEKAKAESEKQNLARKNEIIKEIEELVNEENIKQAMARIKELEEEWKNVGNVANATYQELQQNYSRARDAFFYNMRIYRELLEHDLKRNLQLKEDLAEKMHETLKIDKIKELEMITRSLSAEWDEVGPTFHDKWEGVRDKFKDAQRKAFEKIKEHYQGVRAQLQDNLDKKAELCKRIEDMVEQEVQSEKRWRKLTDEVIAIQKEWKTIGFVPRQDNDMIWQRFKTAGDKFFDQKKAFYASLKSEQDKFRDAKKALVEKAEELKSSEDWKETTETLIRLQREWKKIGTAHQRDEQRLWKQFRAACNHFFEAKKGFFDTKDERQDQNLKDKEAILNELENLSTDGDDNETIKKIDQLVNRFAAVGFVPIEAKNKINSAFKNALNKRYKEIGLGAEDVKKLMYLAKIKDMGDAKGKTDDRAVQREERGLRERISKLKATIVQYENNLGFFANSKGANKLKEEVEQKIEQAKQQVEELKEQLQLLKQSKQEGFKNPFVVEGQKDKEQATPEAEPTAPSEESTTEKEESN